jgi:uncharacterized protein (TIGR00725 family)
LTGPGDAVYVAVCGAGTPAGPEDEAWAEEVGRLLAGAGAVVLCGGVSGVMDAVARGAASEGGVSIGILPGPDRADASPSLTFSIPTGMGETRNALLVRSADAVIAIAGETGTLSEIALALKIGVPVVGLHTWELRRPDGSAAPLETARTPEEAVRKALGAARGRKGA